METLRKYKNIILLALSLILFIISIGLLCSIFFFYGIALAIIAALMAASVFGEFIGNKFALGIYMPQARHDKPPVIFGPVQSKIKNEDYEGAIEDLTEILEKNPGNPEAIGLLSDLFIDKTHDYKDAYGLLFSYLSGRKIPVPGDAELVMKAVDACLSLNMNGKAIEILKMESAKKYPARDAQNMKTRLKALRQAL